MSTNLVRRHWWVASLLGLWWTGLGHLYCGANRRGLLWFFTCSIGGLLALVALRFAVVLGLVLSLVVGLLILLSVVDAAIVANRIGMMEIRKYTAGYLYVIFGLSLSVLFSILPFDIKRDFVEAYRVPSGTMEPAIIVGDHILVDKRAYTTGSLPRRGDIVVFTLPDDPTTLDVDESAINIVKRIVGIGGEKLELRGTELFIDDKPYSEPYAKYTEGGLKSFGPVSVPPGTVVVLGDNRDHSKDSRYYKSPFLDVGRITGKAYAIYWNWSPRGWSRIGTQF